MHIASAQSAFEFDGSTSHNWMVDGPHRSEGILELHFLGQWGGISGGTFNIVTADVACFGVHKKQKYAYRLVSRFEQSSVWLTSSIKCVTL